MKTHQRTKLQMNHLSFLFLISISLSALGNCPDLTKNETAEDCPWAEITRQIVDQKKPCDPVLKASVPFIFEQFSKDQKAQEFLTLWGEAKNYDENAKAIIVDSKILQCLAEKLKLKNAVQPQNGFESVHAGLQHTYAYLFSNTPTPYGYKRARWTKDDIEKGFGLSKKALTPETKKGAFLSNVTYFFAKFAFQDDSELIKKLEAVGRKNKSVSPELMSLKTEKFQIKNLVETLPEKQIILHTTFVKMNPEKLISKNTYLLIYWVENQKNKTKSLITGFPVETSFVDRVLDEKNIGSKKPISTHYNAWISALTNAKETLMGSTEVR